MNPFHLGILAVAKTHHRGVLVGDVVLSHFEVFGADGDVVLEIALIFVEGVVVVDILDIGYTAPRLIEAVGGIFGRERVPFHSVVVLVALENRESLLIVVVSAVEVVVVAGGVVERRELVGFHLRDCCGVEFGAQLSHIVGVGGECKLLLGAQSVESEVLFLAGARSVVESVGESVLSGNASPHGLFHVGVVVIDGITVLVGFHSIFEDILAHLAEVDVEVAALVVWVFGVEERVEHPKLDVFNVAGLEIGVVEFAHDAAPAFLGEEKFAVIVDVGGIEVVGTAFLGVEREVESLDSRRLAIVELLGGEQLALCDFAHIQVGLLLLVVFDVSGRARRIALGEHPVDVVPSEEGTVFAIFGIVAQCRFGEKCSAGVVVWSRSEEPGIGGAEVDTGLCGLEIVDIRATLGRAGLLRVGNELGKFGSEAHRRRRCGIHRGYLVHNVGEPHKLVVIAEVQAPDGVVDGLGAYRHFLGDGTLGEVHHGGSDVEIFIELVVEVETEERFALSAEHRLVFHRHIDACSGIDDALVEDSYDTHVVIHRVVAVFGEGYTSGSYHHRASRHIHGVEPDLRAARSLIFAREHIFVLVLHLSSHGESGVIEFLEHKLVGDGRVVDFLLKPFAKRLYNRENHLAVRRNYRVAFDEVEITVATCLVVLVEAVEVHNLQ